MPPTPPTDVDLVYGHPDGTIRTYHVKGFIAEPGMKLLDIRKLRLSSPTTGSTDNPILMAAGNVYVYLGAGIVIDHYFGGVGLIVTGLLLLGWRQVWLRTLRIHQASMQVQSDHANRS